MAISIPDFWRLSFESRLLGADECRQLARLFAEATGATRQGDTAPLVKWLVTRGAISRYQAKVLLAGRAGPFLYGDYRIYDRYESGRLAGLFRAVHMPTKHPVSLYFLAGVALENPQTVARLAQQAAAANHAGQGQVHLARCFHLVDLGTYKFLVLEDLQGDSLDLRLASCGKMPPAEACRIARQAALGLARLHALGQVHGEIRPANLWLSPRGTVKLLHFPLARDPLPAYGGPLAEVISPANRGGPLPPEADYLAPELAGGQRGPDARSDIYSLGCTLYRMLGQSAEGGFAGGDLKHKAARQGSQAPARLDVLNPAVPPALAKLVAYMLAEDADLRYQQATSVVEALSPYLEPADPPAAAREAPSTGHAYETWLGQQRAVTARSRVVPAAVAVPRVPVPPSPGRAPVVAPVLVPAAVVAPAASAAQRLRRASAASQRTVVGAMIGIAALVLVVVGIYLLPGGHDAQPELARGSSGDQTAMADQRPTTGTHEPTPESKTGPASDKGNGKPGARAPLETVQGIDEPIWESPTAGEPLDLRYLAPGVQAVVALRPADLVKHAEWEKLSDPRTLGPLSNWAAAELPALAGTSLDNIEMVLIGLLDAGEGPPRPALVIRTLKAVPIPDLLDAWGQPVRAKVKLETIYELPERACYVPPAGEGRIVVVAPAAELREVVAAEGEAPALRRELEELLGSSDSQRHFTMLVAPSFLFTGGKALLGGSALRLKDPLNWFLTLEDVQQKLDLPKAALVSWHLGDDFFFIELRIHNSFAGRPTSAVARQLYDDRVAELARHVNQYVRELSPSRYSKEVLWDFPAQVRVLAQFTRAGIDGNQAVLRAYLPAAAAHNLALGAHLALLESPGGAPVAAAVGPARPQSVAERLKQKISLGFPRNTLEAAIKLLGEEVGVEVVILGTDLQAEGITKNQSFGLDERDLPADEILRKIMLLARPDGKLIYVVKPKEDGGEEVVYVTTRAAAKNRQDKLPPELEQESP